MDEPEKKRLLRVIPYGLYAACTRAPDGGHHVFLLSWVTQASFRPPLVVCCIHLDSAAHAHLLGGKRPLTINLLSDDQHKLATDILKDPDFGPSAVAGTSYILGPNGCAMLPETLGAIECVVIDRVVHGDHAIFVCEVTGAREFRKGTPLTHEDTGWKYGG